MHDPKHRPIPDATVSLKAKGSDYAKTTNTDASGEFIFDAVPLGEYSISVSKDGFGTIEQATTVLSGTAPGFPSGITDRARIKKPSPLMPRQLKQKPPRQRPM